MAQGQTEYDSAAAQAAADAILANATSTDWEIMWPEGSAQGEVPDSEALPAIWQNPDDFQAKHQALIDAATNLQAVAGTDLASLQAGLGGVGQSCGACHQAYRAPSQ
jgi:cytochrome c556